MLKHAVMFWQRATCICDTVWPHSVVVTPGCGKVLEFSGKVELGHLYAKACRLVSLGHKYAEAAASARFK